LLLAQWWAWFAAAEPCVNFFRFDSLLHSQMRAWRGEQQDSGIAEASSTLAVGRAYTLEKLDLPTTFSLNHGYQPE
jgi:hypothetical protein